MSMEWYNQSSHKARKEHKCEMCGQKIKAGEEYTKEVGKFDGDFFERILHPECFEMLNYILGEMGENEFSWDDLSDWWNVNKCCDCVHRYITLCEPNEQCYSQDCINNIRGYCKDDETCDEMTRVRWCEKFKTSVTISE